MNKKSILITCFFFFFLCFVFSRTNSSLVIKVSLDKKYDSFLKENEKTLFNSAYMRGLQDLTIVQEISIRSDEIDKKLRQIQKQSQIDAMVGLVNEDEAYSADKGTRADLSMDFILNTVGKDKYQIVCTVSEIEEMKVLTTQTTARLSFSELTDNKIIDELIYKR